MSISAFGVDHGETVSKAWKSDKPKYKGTLLMDGGNVDTIGIHSNGRSAFRKRPKYQLVAHASKPGKTQPHVGTFKPTKAAAAELAVHMATGKKKTTGKSGFKYETRS